MAKNWITAQFFIKFKSWAKKSVVNWTHPRMRSCWCSINYLPVKDPGPAQNSRTDISASGNNISLQIPYCWKNLQEKNTLNMVFFMLGIFPAMLYPSQWIPNLWLNVHKSCSHLWQADAECTQQLSMPWNMETNWTHGISPAPKVSNFDRQSLAGKVSPWSRFNSFGCVILYAELCNFGLHHRVFLWHADGFMQERHNSIANALQLRLSCTYSSMFVPSSYAITLNPKAFTEWTWVMQPFMTGWSWTTLTAQWAMNYRDTLDTWFQNRAQGIQLWQTQFSRRRNILSHFGVNVVRPGDAYS